MSDDFSLVEMAIGTFSVIVPPFRLCSLEQSSIVLERFLYSDSQGAFDQALAMFIDAMAPDKVNDFYALENEQMVFIVAEWITT